MINLRNFKNNSAYTENVNSIELPNVSHLEYEHEVKFKGVDYSKEYLTFYVVGGGVVSPSLEMTSNTVLMMARHGIH